jgi:hypothetical protein
MQLQGNYTNTETLYKDVEQNFLSKYGLRLTNLKVYYY